jgi:hypothetical protein
LKKQADTDQSGQRGLGGDLFSERTLIDRQGGYCRHLQASGMKTSHMPSCDILLLQTETDQLNKQIVVMSETPLIKVGVLSGKEIRFNLNGSFSDLRNNKLREGTYTAGLQKGKIVLSARDMEKTIAPGTVFHPDDNGGGTFTLHNVRIG